MTVLLFNPPYMRRAGSSHVEPIGLAGLSSALQQAGARVVLFDAAASLPDWPYGQDQLASLIASQVRAAGPIALVGVGPLVTATLASSRAVIEVVRKVTTAPVVVGGPLCATPGIEPVAGDYLRVNAWVAGDGEDPIVALWRRVAASGWPEAGEIPGLGILGQTEPSPYRTQDLDRLPLPDRAALTAATTPSARRGLGRRKSTAAFLSRGCPYACTFCAAPLASGRKVRRFSPARVAREIASCRELGYDDIVFYDDCLFVRGSALDERVAEFTGALADARWDGTYQLELRCDAVLHMSDGSIADLRASGLRQVNMGIEKGHIAALKQLRKRLTPDTAREACDRLVASGLRAAGTFILGGLGEDLDDVRGTVDFACSLPLDFAHFNPLAVYPGTQLYDETFGQGTPWLDLCLDPGWAPRGDILFRSKELSLDVVANEIAEAYRRFYSEERLAIALQRVPAAEHPSLVAAYQLLSLERAPSLGGSLDVASEGIDAC